MAPRLAHYTKLRIIHLQSFGLSLVEIHRRLREEGLNANRKSISSIISKFKRMNTIRDLPRSGRPLKFNFDVAGLIDKFLKENDELTPIDLQSKILTIEGVRVSLSHIKRERRKIGWIRTGGKYCQLTHGENQKNRSKEEVGLG